MPKLEIDQFACLSDNYGVLIHDPEAGVTASIDAPDAKAILARLEAKGWKLTHLLNTHHHGDHTGGNLQLKEATGCIVIGPKGEAERIPGIDVEVAEGDTVQFGNFPVKVIDTPGHTLGHVAYFIPDAKVAFVGDTMFAMGCGRLFEGNAEQMHDNLQRLAALPPETEIYCAHEYTLSNGRFALVAEPDNQAIRERMVRVEAARGVNEATVPTTVALERATNPFVRAASAEHLAALRQAKDNFRG